LTCKEGECTHKQIYLKSITNNSNNTPQHNNCK